MKTLPRICMVVLGATAVNLGLSGVAAAQDDELVGSWQCSGATEDPDMGMSLAVDVDQTYTDAGAYERTSTLTLEMTSLQLSMSAVIDEAGAWEREGMALTETPSRMDVSSTSEEPNPIESLLLSEMQAEAAADVNTSTTLDIGTLTATTMTIEDEEFVLTCEKA